MLGGADNPNGELPSYITGADSFARESARKRNDTRDKVALVRTGVNIGQRIFVFCSYPHIQPLDPTNDPWKIQIRSQHLYSSRYYWPERGIT